MPRFHRVLKRAEAAWKLVSLKETKLPPPYKPSRGESNSRLCQNTALRLLYIKAFPAWLDGCSAEKINELIELSVKRSIDQAQRVNQDPDAVAQMAGLVRLQDGEGIGNFIAQLAARTATELRVQLAYDPNPDGARKQSEYLDNLKCDVFLLAFEDYLLEKNFGWLLDEWAGRHERSGSLSFDGLYKPASEPENAEYWQQMLYVVLHLVPVDEVSKLLHQLRKWDILSQQVEC